VDDTEGFMYCRGWSEAKPGHACEQNQDAFTARVTRDAAGERLLLAICDGATSTVYAGPWARALVTAAEPDWPGLDDDALTGRLDAVREQFTLALPEDLPWPQAHKIAKEGSQATLLVASLTRAPGSGEVTCQAVAVGDSSLILFPREGPTASFPLARSADFGTSPRLVSSRPQPALGYERWTATLGPGDILIGCTDAVGQWTLQGVESADATSCLRLLLDLLGDREIPEPAAQAATTSLSARIAGAAARALADDDVTLMLCVPVPAGSERMPLSFAREVVNAHLTGDFDGLRPAELPPAPPRATVLDVLKRIGAALVRLAVTLWRLVRRQR
jgi:hypothetical protein